MKFRPTASATIAGAATTRGSDMTLRMMAIMMMSMLVMMMMLAALVPEQC